MTTRRTPALTLPEIPLAESRSLYALAGAGDLAVAALRQVPGRLAGLRAEPAPRAAAADLQARVVGLGARAETVYDELAGRGKRVVTRIRRQRATQDLQAQAESTARRTRAARTTARTSAASTRSATKGVATSARRAAAAAGTAMRAGAAKVG